MVKKKRKYIEEESNVSPTIVFNKKYYISIIEIFTIGIITIAFIKLGLGTEKNTKSVYQYKIEKKSDYEVLLKSNDLYTTNILPADLYYVSKSIDTFSINFEYELKGNKKIDTEVNYNITANLIGTVKDEYQDKEVWNKSFNILENKSDKQVDTDIVSIKEKVDIDYDQYNKLVTLYEKEYGIKIDAVLKLRFNITYQNNLSNYNINTEKIDDFIELNIPITDTITEVNKNYENENVVDIMPPIEKIKIKKYIYYTIAGLCIIIDCFICIEKIKKNKITVQKKYERSINHILKYYKDIIVTVNSKPDFADLKMMELIIFDDLIDVAEQNNCNIIHYEDRENKINYLYAIVDQYVYYYKLVMNI